MTIIISEYTNTDKGQHGWKNWHHNQLWKTQGYSQIAKVKASWNQHHDLYYYVSWPKSDGWEIDKQTRRIYHPDSIDNRDGHIRAFVLAMQEFSRWLNMREKDYKTAIKLCGCSVQQPKGEYLFFWQYMEMEIKAYEQMGQYLAENPDELTMPQYWERTN